MGDDQKLFQAQEEAGEGVWCSGTEHSVSSLVEKRDQSDENMKTLQTESLMPALHQVLETQHPQLQDDTIKVQKSSVVMGDTSQKRAGGRGDQS